MEAFSEGQSSVRGNQVWDVVVIGAGPAGSASAALLSAQGHRVLVLEKVAFPRFQIGESLLPVCLPVLARLGVEAREDVFVFKRGAEFVCEAMGARRVFDFSQALPGTPPHAWQVDRSGFDALLRDAAVRAGAQVLHGQKVLRVSAGEGGAGRAVVRTAEAEHEARFVLDATGQNRLLARHFDAAEPFEGFGHAAAFSHFEGLSDQAIEEIGPGHDIRIMIVPQGWGWVIPLPHRRLSVGLVTRGSGVAEELEQYIADSELITRWTRGAVRTEAKVARNFSFKNRRPYGSRYACVGDAACFLDPVFSSGVSLALVGAERTVDRLGHALIEGREEEPDLMRPVAAAMDRAYLTFSAIIDRFYHTHFIKHFIFGETQDEAIQRGVVSVLAGDVWRDDNPFQKMLTHSRRAARFSPPAPASACV